METHDTCDRRISHTHHRCGSPELPVRVLKSWQYGMTDGYLLLHRHLGGLEVSTLVTPVFLQIEDREIQLHIDPL